MSTEKNGLDVFTAMSLCSGYEGLGIGLKRAIPNLRTVCYVENEAFACANLVAKIKEGFLDDAPIWDDIKDFDAKPFAGMVDIIHSRFPCQPFSFAGRRQGESDPRHLWPFIAGIVAAVEPVWCFFENVGGHLSLGFPAVYRDLRNLGYSVEAGLFTAAEVGAPHRRTRLFILAKSDRGRIGTGYAICESDLSERPSQLADAQGERCREAWRHSDRGAKRIAVCNKTMADTGNTEHERWQSVAGNNGEKFQAVAGICDKWPARPGQSQYEWEEPRIVDNATQYRNTTIQQQRQRSSIEPSSIVGDTRSDIQRRQSRSIRNASGESITDTKQSRKIRHNIRGSSEQRQTEPSMGKSAYGNSGGMVRSRMDQLRLLGNGCVPAQVEKAFRTLMTLFG